MTARTMSVITALATALNAMENCRKSGNDEWLDKWSERIDNIEKNYLPSGSGFDCGTKVMRERCEDNRIVLHTSFHHMDEYGRYDGWTEHTIAVVPSFIHNFELRVSGRDRNDIKEYISETFHAALSEQISW